MKKKIFLSLLIVLSLVIITGCDKKDNNKTENNNYNQNINNNTNSNQNKDVNDSSTNNSNNDSSISNHENSEIIDSFYKYFNSNEAKVIYYASKTCYYCSLQTPIIEKIARDYNIDYLKIEVSELKMEDRQKIISELKINGATPTTIIVQNGQVIATQIGYVEGNRMVEFLKSGNILADDAVYYE